MKNKLKLSLILLLLNSPAIALTGKTPKLDPESPTYSKSASITAIYQTACRIGTDETLARIMPMNTIDNTSIALGKNHPDIPKFLIRSLTFSGINLGLVLNFTDLTNSDKLEICRRYANLFMASIVNNPDHLANQKEIKLRLVAVDLKVSPKLTNNLTDDFLKPKEEIRIEVTPRIAEQNGCRYMFHVLASKPVIEYNAMDATIEIMMNMMWNDYRVADIRFAYQYLLEGAKLGRFLQVSGQKEELCYD